MSDIDEGLDSRQLYVLGKEAMQKLNNACVLISGVDGLGVEIAKNIMLCGVKSLIIQDCQTVKYTDLSSQFYLTEDDIGKNRAQVTYSKLLELNKTVHLTYSSDSLTEQLIESSNIDILVLTNAINGEQLTISNYCHKNKIKYIIVTTKGLFGQIFCDFGENFQVLDTNGEKALVHIVTGISHDEKGEVAVLHFERHGFDDGSYVTFSDVKGMDEVNEKEFKITVQTPYKFTIGDTTNFGIYDRGGKVTEVKKSETIHFKSFSDSLIKPDLPICDFNKISMSANLHLAFQALTEFKQMYSTVPKPWDDADAEKFFEIAYQINMKTPNEPLTDDLNKNWIQLFSKTCTGDLCPIQSIIGGITTQETMKALTGKFMPIKQFFYFDAIECLPEHILLPSSQSVLNKNSRYYSQETIFGKDFQNQLGKLKYFLVGAGAIGCEILKNFSMMGIGCEKGGVVHVADMDTIAKSNLNRHFLFRSSNIGHMKTDTIAQNVLTLNSSINVCTFAERVDSKTEHVFDDRFYERIDGIIDATDNASTHKYLDNPCVNYRKPLIVSGALGIKSNVQVVVPMLTESYCSTDDPPELSISTDQIINFPHQIEHTIDWACDRFIELFIESPELANEYMRDPKDFVEKIFESHSESHINFKIDQIQRILGSCRPKTFFDCIHWARNYFDEKFHHNIARLLAHFPPDHVTHNGQLFWIEHKMCPHSLLFDFNNETHLKFIVAASNLMAHIYNIPQLTDQFEITRQVKLKSDLETYVSSDEHFDTTEYKVEEILSHLPKSDEMIDLKIQPHVLKLEDDVNFQLDFIVAMANIRAENYGIKIVERSEVLRIAGKIIPAIVTTSSMLAGLISLEVFKLVHGHKNIEYFKNSFVNMALPFFIFSEHVPVKRQKYLEHEFTLWDRFEVQGDMNLEEFIEYFKKKHQLCITFISAASFLIYSCLLPKRSHRKEDMQRKIWEIYEKLSKKKLPDNVRSLTLDIVCDDLAGKEIANVPNVKYTFQ